MLNQPLDYPSYTSHVAAKQATLRALLNSYLRETGCQDPRQGATGLDAALLDEGEEFCIPLPRCGGSMLGTLRYFSLLGQHRYGSAFYLRNAQGRVTPLDMQDVIQRILEELGSHEEGNTQELRLWDMREKINNSFAKMAAYLDAFQLRHPDGQPLKLDFIAAEQSLLLGHPFHPFPKCSQGAERREFSNFSPERQATFKLHYLAVRRPLLVEDWVGDPNAGLADEVLSVACERLGERFADYGIMPMHPWQASYLLPQRDVQPLLANGDIVDLGVMGPMAYPTSSVRSVWVPETGHGYKLPLQVRITNLVRENTLEQSQRTLDAARVIRRLQDELESDEFKVILETGYQTLSADRSGLEAHRVPAFTVLHRPMDIDERRTFVVASLLEAYPGHDEPKLISAIRDSGAGSMVNLHQWFEAYLSISMMPLLKVLARTGVSFEAHLQNAQVMIEDGWPRTFYVRDLEGVSLDRSQVEDSAWWKALNIAADSPILYPPEIAWKRTQYYFFVNHLGGVVHALADYLGVDEGEFWRLAGTVLERERDPHDARLCGYIDELLHARHWPAKANFLSCFQQRGDTPLFIDVINPIKASR